MEVANRRPGTTTIVIRTRTTVSTGSATRPEGSNPFPASVRLNVPLQPFDVFVYVIVHEGYFAGPSKRDRLHPANMPPIFSLANAGHVPIMFFMTDEDKEYEERCNRRIVKNLSEAIEALLPEIAKARGFLSEMGGYETLVCSDIDPDVPGGFKQAWTTLGEIEGLFVAMKRFEVPPPAADK